MERIKVKICVKEYSRPLYETLLTEAIQPAPAKASVSVYVEGDCVILQIEARNLSKLRAVFNSYAYLAHAAYSALTLSDRRFQETRISPRS